jgi:hypothetical protein
MDKKKDHPAIIIIVELMDVKKKGCAFSELKDDEVDNAIDTLETAMSPSMMA